MKTTSSGFLELAEQVESEGSGYTPTSAVQSTSANLRAADAFGVSPADLFDALAYGLGRAGGASDSFAIVASPGERLQQTLHEGDLFLRRGDGDTAHISVIADPRVYDLEAALSEGMTTEAFRPGTFVHVAETAPFLHTSSDRFARQLTDSAGRLLTNIMLLRLATPPPTVIVQPPPKPAAEPGADPDAFLSLVDFLSTEEAPPFGPSAADSGSLVKPLADAVRSGTITLQVGLAIMSGQRDSNLLTNMIFYARHSELPMGYKIQFREEHLKTEWLDIRERVVLPLLQAVSSTPKPTTSSSVATQQSATSPLVLGIDFADGDHNRNVDWARVKAEGPIQFAILRAHTGWRPDHVFSTEWPRVKEAGIVRGAYLFLAFPHPKYGNHAPNPVVQAQGFIKTVGDLEPTDLPPTLDVEFPGSSAVTGMSHRQLLDGVRAAWKVLQERYGIAPMIYTSARVWREDLNDLPAPDLVESPLWLTPYPFGSKTQAVRNPEAFAPGGRYHPPRVPPSWGAGNWWIHQYQGDAYGLPGLHQVDMNRFNLMQPGETGERVKWVERRLKIAQSGSFTASTESALKRFQQNKSIDPTGTVDIRTFAALCWA